MLIFTIFPIPRISLVVVDYCHEYDGQLKKFSVY